MADIPINVDENQLKPIPKYCPKCRCPYQINSEGKWICANCKGEIYYDDCLGIFRLRSIENEEA